MYSFCLPLLCFIRPLGLSCSINSNGSSRKGIDDDETEGDDEDSNVNCNTAGTNTIIISKTHEKKLICSSSGSSNSISSNGTANRHCNKNLNLKCNKNDSHGGKNCHGTTAMNGDTNKTTVAAHQ